MQMKEAGDRRRQSKAEGSRRRWSVGAGAAAAGGSWHAAAPCRTHPFKPIQTTTAVNEEDYSSVTRPTATDTDIVQRSTIDPAPPDDAGRGATAYFNNNELLLCRRHYYF
jgi:hypothetical protein